LASPDKYKIRPSKLLLMIKSGMASASINPTNKHSSLLGPYS
jgi:hypothetical protein